MTPSEKPTFQLPSPLAPYFLISLGIVLSAISFLPLESLFTTSTWETEDSAQLAAIRKKLHETNYKSPERQGLTAEEADAAQDKMKEEINRLNKKLEWAKSGPKIWSRILLGSGIALILIGAIWQQST